MLIWRLTGVAAMLQLTHGTRSAHPMSWRRYHVTARGNERKDIFRDDTHRFRFLEMLSEAGPRFGARVHACVLMANHHHPLLETPEANLSRTMQWCNVSYSVWFNLRHRRVGHLLQGRFRADLMMSIQPHDLADDGASRGRRRPRPERVYPG
jgi:REP element-mobilizing transposase RayT